MAGIGMNTYSPTSTLTYAIYKHHGAYVRGESNFVFVHPTIKDEVDPEDIDDIAWDKVSILRDWDLAAGWVWNAHRNMLVLMGLGINSYDIFGKTISGDIVSYYSDYYDKSMRKYILTDVVAPYLDLGMVFHIRRFSIGIGGKIGTDGYGGSFGSANFSFGVNF